jgi:group II intron reverse transcriptase/maturase
MKETDNYDKSRQLQIEDYLQEVKLETESIVEVHSNLSGAFKRINDRNTMQNGMLEEILSNNNMNNAYKRVKANKGSHGVDGMKIDELLAYLIQNGDQIKQEILGGTYNPQAIRRVEIPKDNGKKRKLGIPVVVDRVIQQAIAQVLTPIYENKFSENSYGFRPNKSAHQAIKKCGEYINAVYKWAIDIDLAQFFDKVNHDKLIQIMSKDIKDGRVLSLISKYLKAKVSINGKLEESLLGTPQGGNISPLLSNIMLNELDVELTKRNYIKK